MFPATLPKTPRNIPTRTIMLAKPKATITFYPALPGFRKKKDDLNNYFGQTANLQYCITSNFMEIVL